MDLITTYFPKFGELTDTEVQAARDRLVAYWQPAFPDTDMRPGSPFGDKVVTALAYFLAAAETGADRFCSDLDLEKVASGVIYNCDFVGQFLKNFAIFPKEGLYATGIVRLVFSTDEARELDRGIKMRFGNSENNIFYFRLPSPGSVHILPVGASRIAGSNTYPMVQLSDTMFAADIPVQGQMDAAVLVEDTADVNTVVDGLSGISALVDFDAGRAAESLKVLAARTQETFHSASMTQRHAASRYLKKEYPDIITASAVVAGDKEMMRSTVNPLGFSNGAMDVYIRSSHFQRIESHTVRLEYISDQDGMSIDRFIGKLNLAGVPVQIQKIAYAGNAALNLDNGGGSVTIYSRSKDQARAPMLAAGFTAFEELWAAIKMPRGISENALIVPEIDAQGNQYAYFNITYKTEPMLPVLSDYLDAYDVRPQGVSVLVRAQLPITLKALIIRYRRPAGTNVNLEQAREEIYNYLFKLGYPGIYTDAKISDAMFYAGASSVVAVECIGRLRWTVADKVIPVGTPTPAADFLTCDEEAILPPQMDMRSSRGFLDDYRDQDAGADAATFVASGFRNTGILVDRADILFKEESL